MLNSDYKKYIKYKTKYLNLRGGASSSTFTINDIYNYLKDKLNKSFDLCKSNDLWPIKDILVEIQKKY